MPFAGESAPLAGLCASECASDLAELPGRPHHSWRMRDLPSGTVTLLFTDIEGSTKLLQELGMPGSEG
jgi:hypothetical protein